MRWPRSAAWTLCSRIGCPGAVSAGSARARWTSRSSRVVNRRFGRSGTVRYTTIRPIQSFPTGSGRRSPRSSSCPRGISFLYSAPQGSIDRVRACVWKDGGPLLSRCRLSLPVPRRLQIGSQRASSPPQRSEARNQRCHANLERHPRRGPRVGPSRCPVTIGVFRLGVRAWGLLRRHEQHRRLRALLTAPALTPANGSGYLSRRLRPAGVPPLTEWVGTGAVTRALLCGPAIGSVAYANRTLVL
jgi:hypothetical protein